jgi:LPXTG-motif cell wall-anchored protein
MTAAGDAASAADIRDIRLPGGSDSSVPTLALVIGATLAVLLGAAYLVWRRRRRRRAPPRSFELALQQLEEARSLLRADRANEYCVAVSTILRRYIEAGFRIQVTQRTTEEFLGELAGRVDSPLLRHRARLEALLHGCDAAKFGLGPRDEHGGA